MKGEAVHGLGTERLLQRPLAKGFQGQPCELDLTKQGWREPTHCFSVLLLFRGTMFNIQLWVSPVSQPDSA